MSVDSGDMANDDLSHRQSSVSASSSTFFDSCRLSGEDSPMLMSPWNKTSSASPFSKSTRWFTGYEGDDASTAAGLLQNSLIGAMVREEGHIYSLAVTGDLLYTGSDSKNIRVWKNLKEFSGFKSSSGLVKAIIVSNNKIFTGHQDGKIRVWKVSPKAPSFHKRAGTLPTLKNIFKSSINPSNYIEVMKRRAALWIKHSDAVSCLSLNEEDGLLYSASWDQKIKVWRVADSKCLESIKAHDDAVNAVVASTADGLVFSGAADGTVKVWKRESLAKSTKHTLAEMLVKQECAITSLSVNKDGCIVYCGSSDGLVNHWMREAEKGKLQFSHCGVLRGHKLAILCLVAAGLLVLSGSADKTICVWRKEGQTIPGCRYGRAYGTYNTNNKRTRQRWIVYSGSLDMSVKVWSVWEIASNGGSGTSLFRQGVCPVVRQLLSLSRGGRSEEERVTREVL
ncbi:hypothetical protein SAY87_004489 [Trapa incisa]|uniref:Uncharacterized protein n=1 Tax=Trapa incisa TaxID=236973 RepID=A0AAN7PKN9_9MYRT|nr:hypothetical protein SAY87_004489 [Trapa incisa]